MAEETYEGEGSVERTGDKEFILLQVHFKRGALSTDFLNTIEPLEKKREKKGIAQDRRNANSRGGVSFEDFVRIANQSGYYLDNVWKRDDTEYVDGELAGEVGVALGFVFRKGDRPNNDDSVKQLNGVVEGKLFNVHFHYNTDGSTVMSAFGGQDYSFRGGEDKIKRQVFVDESVVPVKVGERWVYAKRQAKSDVVR